MSNKTLSIHYLQRAESHLGHVDYKIGNIILSKHLDTKLISALCFPDYVKQMLGQQRSGFPSQRVPLYVCQECGDIGCGAITVELEQTETHFIWRTFGFEAPYASDISQSEYMKRTGPFSFEKTQS